MMQLAEKKRCFLCDLDNVPSEEVDLWLAYYDKVATEDKKAQQRAEISAKLAGKA